MSAATGAREVTVKVPNIIFQTGCRLLRERVGWKQTISANEQKDLQAQISKAKGVLTCLSLRRSGMQWWWKCVKVHAEIECNSEPSSCKSRGFKHRANPSFKQ
jgi:hypothetical protein